MRTQSYLRLVHDAATIEHPHAAALIAAVLRDRGETQLAVAYARRAVAVAAHDPDAWNTLASCLSNLGLCEQALEAAETSVALNSDVRTNYRGHTTLLAQQRKTLRLDAAYGTYLKGRVLYAKDPYFLRAAGVLFLDLGDGRTADDLFARAAEHSAGGDWTGETPGRREMLAQIKDHASPSTRATICALEDHMTPRVTYASDLPF